jgi:hypothetical protein
LPVTKDEIKGRIETIVHWNADLIPFIAVGNGDFFCLSAAAGPQSGVYYVDHEGDTQRITESFDGWLERLEYFLNG